MVDKTISYTPIVRGNLVSESKIRDKRAKAYILSNKKKKRKYHLKSLIFASICVAGFFIGIDLYAKEPEEQKYIVRYGTIICNGECSEFVAESGERYLISDAPEVSCDTRLRVLFDSKETSATDDDLIIDITEE